MASDEGDPADPADLELSIAFEVLDDQAQRKGVFVQLRGEKVEVRVAAGGEGGGACSGPCGHPAPFTAPHYLMLALLSAGTHKRSMAEGLGRGCSHTHEEHG